MNIEQILDPKHSALIVVDIQNDFCSDEGLFARLGKNVSKIQEMVPNLTNFIDKARKVNMPIVYIQAIYNKKYLPKNILERYHKNPLNVSTPS